VKCFIWVVNKGANYIGEYTALAVKQIGSWVQNQTKSEKYDTVFFVFGILGGLLASIASNHFLIRNIIWTIIVGGFSSFFAELGERKKYKRIRSYEDKSLGIGSNTERTDSSKSKMMG